MSEVVLQHSTGSSRLALAPPPERCQERGPCACCDTQYPSPTSTPSSFLNIPSQLHKLPYKYFNKPFTSNLTSDALVLGTMSMSRIAECSSFPRFNDLPNDLPKEIRLYIWVHALPGPRFIFTQQGQGNCHGHFVSQPPQLRLLRLQVV